MDVGTAIRISRRLLSRRPVCGVERRDFPLLPFSAHVRGAIPHREVGDGAPEHQLPVADFCPASLRRDGWEESATRFGNTARLPNSDLDRVSVSAAAGRFWLSWLGGSGTAAPGGRVLRRVTQEGLISGAHGRGLCGQWVRATERDPVGFASAVTTLAAAIHDTTKNAQHSTRSARVGHSRVSSTSRGSPWAMSGDRTPPLERVYVKKLDFGLPTRAVCFAPSKFASNPTGCVGGRAVSTSAKWADTCHILPRTRQLVNLCGSSSICQWCQLRQLSAKVSESVSDLSNSSEKEKSTIDTSLDEEKYRQRREELVSSRWHQQQQQQEEEEREDRDGQEASEVGIANGDPIDLSGWREAQLVQDMVELQQVGGSNLGELAGQQQQQQQQEEEEEEEEEEPGEEQVEREWERREVENLGLLGPGEGRPDPEGRDYFHVLDIEELTKTLQNVRARNIVTLYVRDRCTFTDWMVIVTGRSGRHLRAMADAVVYELKRRTSEVIPDLEPAVEGRDVDQWMVVDCGSMVVHFFDEETRERYNLEELWAEGGGGGGGDGGQESSSRTSTSE
ncbi:hypothetical protein CBR_g17596 [Chara braunii]|uniref:Uncharacterized protein n=1 Tax=Chara braunii TaxID=69332 RepID=A0A388KUY9_CHABU|nr:hypothetical protein CBR_g17596 [Chara braunii]|eukprot:GBG73884.1 hypothetical protein CBR_g17596 [Chara braunii]